MGAAWSSSKGTDLGVSTPCVLFLARLHEPWANCSCSLSLCLVSLECKLFGAETFSHYAYSTAGPLSTVLQICFPCFQLGYIPAFREQKDCEVRFSKDLKGVRHHLSRSTGAGLLNPLKTQHYFLKYYEGHSSWRPILRPDCHTLSTLSVESRPPLCVTGTSP